MQKLQASSKCHCANGGDACCTRAVDLHHCDSTCWGLDYYITSSDGSYIKVDGGDSIGKGVSSKQIYIPESSDNLYTMEFAYDGKWRDAFSSASSRSSSIKLDSYDFFVWFNQYGFDGPDKIYLVGPGCGSQCTTPDIQEKDDQVVEVENPRDIT